jgi:hypothetical protein
MKFGMPSAQIVKGLGRISYAEAEEFILNVMRRKILTIGERSTVEIVREQLKLWTARVRGAKGDAGGDDSAGSSSP